MVTHTVEKVTNNDIVSFLTESDLSRKSCFFRLLEATAASVLVQVKALCNKPRMLAQAVQGSHGFVKN